MPLPHTKLWGQELIQPLGPFQLLATCRFFPIDIVSSFAVGIAIGIGVDFVKIPTAFDTDSDADTDSDTDGNNC